MTLLILYHILKSYKIIQMKTLKERRSESYEKRIEAAALAQNRPHPSSHRSNGDERKYLDEEGNKTYLMSFTKGLKHDPATGLVTSPQHFRQFVEGIETGDPEIFEITPVGPGYLTIDNNAQSKKILDWKSEIAGGQQPVPVRAWESAGAGLSFDLQGPDSMAVTMKPAPALGSDELTAEMGEVYAQALLRDIPFTAFFEVTNKQEEFVNTSYSSALSCFIAKGDKEKVLHLLEALQQLPYFRHASGARSINSIQQVFRGNAKGDTVGPYLSQFLLMGNTGVNRIDQEQRASDGYITYGSIRIDQRVRVAKEKKNYLTHWDEWLDVQNGADLRGLEEYEQGIKGRRFITTPRDLATYVHYDALYQAYLNACLLLLSVGAPFDKGIPFQAKDFIDRQQGFAQYGGPHILTLVTEVATRALKAVRFQKFNIHRRMRPEALAARIQMHKVIENKSLRVRLDSENMYPLTKMQFELNDILKLLTKQNPSFELGFERATCKHQHFDHNYLLPMAFYEGSPMHPSYGAGHATVAGACVTILKAFFDTDQYIKIDPEGKSWTIQSERPETNYCFVPNKYGLALKTVPLLKPLSLEGELNKLASNISIGRNWAGVHYHSDYWESLLMGEQIAIGMLQEQSIMYNPLEDLTMTIHKFNGEVITIDNGELKKEQPIGDIIARGFSN